MVAKSLRDAFQWVMGNLEMAHAVHLSGAEGCELYRLQYNLSQFGNSLLVAEKSKTVS